MKSYILFSEDNNIGKRNLDALISLLIAFSTLWTIAFILSLVVSYPAEGVKNNFTENLQDNIIRLIILFLLIVSIVLLYVYKHKSNRYKYKITITQKELLLAVPQNDRTTYNISELKKYEVVQKIQNLAKVKIIFNDTNIMITTRKYDELKNILEYLMEQNKI